MIYPGPFFIVHNRINKKQKTEGILLSVISERSSTLPKSLLAGPIIYVLSCQVAIIKGTDLNQLGNFTKSVVKRFLKISFGEISLVNGMQNYSLSVT